MILASLHFCFCSQSGCKNNNVFHMDLYQGNVHESNQNVVSNSSHCTKAIVSNLYFFSQLLYRRQLGPKHSKHEAYLEEYGGPLWWRDSSITSDVNIYIDQLSLPVPVNPHSLDKLPMANSFLQNINRNYFRISTFVFLSEFLHI